MSEAAQKMTEAIEKNTAAVEALTKALQFAAGPARPAPARRGPSDPSKWPTAFPNYGKSKGAPIFGATLQDLEYYANGARRSLADPAKERFHEKEGALLDAIEAEIARQGGASGPAHPGGAPSEDDLPF